MALGKTSSLGAPDLKKVVCAGAVCAACAAGVGAHAQGMSDAEIAARFRAQMQSIRAATANPALGASRGLVLSNTAPGGDAATAVQIEPAPPGAGALKLQNPAADTQTAATGSAAVVAHWNLPKGEQVNVQVTFAFDSAALSDSQKPKLRQICGVLGAAGVGVLRIVGHTDASGPWSYNQKLSELRAEEVKRFFVDDCGIAADRLQAVGVGEQFPYDDRNPAAAANRRVEFQAIS
jgi:outer membrane protein OmpA-like peptidoglycan-associated protein